MTGHADVYADLGRETATAFIAGRLDADGLAEVARYVLDLQPARALARVRSGPSVTHTEGNHHAETR